MQNQTLAILHEESPYVCGENMGILNSHKIYSVKYTQI